MVLGLFFHEHKLLVVIFVFEGEFYLNVMSKICDYIEPLCFSKLFHVKYINCRIFVWCRPLHGVYQCAQVHQCVTLTSIHLSNQIFWSECGGAKIAALLAVASHSRRYGAINASILTSTSCYLNATLLNRIVIGF